MIAASATEPTKFPAQTVVHTRSMRPVSRRPLAQAMTIRQSLVNSWAPAMTTSSRPSEKVTPISRRVRP